jgi:hypothetical protein
VAHRRREHAAFDQTELEVIGHGANSANRKGRYTTCPPPIMQP